LRTKREFEFVDSPERNVRCFPRRACKNKTSHTGGHQSPSLVTIKMPPTLSDDEAATIAIAAFSHTDLSPAQLEAITTIATQLASEAPFVDDLTTLFTAYSTLYFRSLLQTTTTFAWSTRMTSCAGTCSLLIDKSTKRPHDPRQCAVRLSEPLLKFRPRSDMLNTLLHEMIHAYLFIAGGRHVRGDDPTGHGSGFQRIAFAINEHGGYSITSTHTFHDEVESYQTHVWQCTGSCRELPPFWGVVKRAMNRPPGPSDTWFEEHQRRCSGGKWVKISEPPPKIKPGKAVPVQKNKIDQWVRIEGSSKSGGGQSGGKRALPPGSESEGRESDDKRPKVKDLAPPLEVLVECPVCPARIAERDINIHLDKVHGF